VKSWLRRGLVRYRHLGVTDADAFLASYPRSGSTWLRFMLFEILTGRDADFDAVNEAVPYVGQHRRAPRLLAGGGRLIKTHELYRPHSWRIVYLVRDVRALLPSMYRQQRRAGSAKEIGAFVEAFVRGDAGPFGSWADHVRFWLGTEPSAEEGLLLVRFEDLRKDPATIVGQILSFLGVDTDGSTVASAIRNNDLAAMKNKERRASKAAILNQRDDLPFVGSGSVEGWRDLVAKDLEMVERSASWALQRVGYPLVRSPGA
jgi:sulfotransferase family protein